MRAILLTMTCFAISGCSERESQNQTSREESVSTASSEPQPPDAPTVVDSPPSSDTNPAVKSTEVTPKSDTSKSDTSKSDTSKSDTEKSSALSVKPLTAEQQKKLLASRLDGGMGYSFGQFANMFLVSSRLHFGTGIGLMTSSEEISSVPLQSPFPATYQPTLREFLDAIAVQTFSEWKYDPSNQYLKGEGGHETPIEGLAIIEFTKSKRKKPFAVTLPDNWKALDKGNWVMYVPPSFPVGMDIYEVGTYSSSQEKVTQQDFANSIRLAVSLEWAQRMNAQAKKEDLIPAKVGTFDALFYESMIPSQLDKEIKWRQWVFMVDDKCYFIVSTILPEFEDKIFPEVEKILASFRVKAK